jgi:2,3-dihydroxybiphenyl 1,2-dioxygenase
MALKSLGYVGIASEKVEEWRTFATKWLGMQCVDAGPDRASFRVDERVPRMVVDRTLPAGGHYFGWEVDDSQALHRLAEHLERHDVQVCRELPSLAVQRGVAELISFHDPAGRRLEAFHSLAMAEQAFEPARPLSGFRTGPVGLGHVVLNVRDLPRARRFYESVLGFKLSDYMASPFVACFFHTNPRHHSLALIESRSEGIHHLMFELLSLDDVGQTYDLLCGEPERIGVSLGRHANDLMTSFYARTPSEFMIEYGWGGLEISPGDWQAHELVNGPSLWGHDRYWLSAEQRAEARALRLRAAERGLQAPVQVLPGNHRLKPV